jgi:hypothetical protein
MKNNFQTVTDFHSLIQDWIKWPTATVVLAIFDKIYTHGKIHGNGKRIGVKVFQIEVCGYSWQCNSSQNYDEWQWFPTGNSNYSKESAISSSINCIWSTTSSLLGFIKFRRGPQIQNGHCRTGSLPDVVCDHLCGLCPFDRSVLSIYMVGDIHHWGGGLINITKVLSLVEAKVKICALKQHKSDKGSDSWPESQKSVLYQNHQVPLMVQYEHK